MSPGLLRRRGVVARRHGGVSALTYNQTVDVDSPLAHWKLGSNGNDRLGAHNLTTSASGVTYGQPALVTNNGGDLAALLATTSGSTTGIGAPSFPGGLWGSPPADHIVGQVTPSAGGQVTESKAWIRRDVSDGTRHNAPAPTGGDDTSSLQTYVNGLSDGTLTNPTIVVLSGGTYRVDTQLSFTNRNHVWFDLNGSTINWNTGDDDTRRLFLFTTCTGIRFRGTGTLNGTYTYPTSGDAHILALQHMHAIHAAGSEVIIQNGVTINGFKGDGVYYGNSGTTQSRGAIDDTCIIQAVGRNGVSCVGVNGLTISAYFERCGWAWMDFEPNPSTANQSVRNVDVNGASFGTNGGTTLHWGIILLPYNTSTSVIQDITIRNCESLGPEDLYIRISNSSPTGLSRPARIRIENNHRTDGTGQQSWMVEAYHVDGLDIIGNDATAATAVIAHLNDCTSVYVSGSTQDGTGNSTVGAPTTTAPAAYDYGATFTKVRMAVYGESGGAATTLIGSSDVLTLNDANAPQSSWVQQTFTWSTPSGALPSTGNVVLALHYGPVGSTLQMGATSGGGGGIEYDGYTFANGAPSGLSGATTRTVSFPISATVTAPGVGGELHDTGGSPSWSNAGTGRTIEAWVKPSSIGSKMGIFGKYTDPGGNTDQYGLAILANGTFEAYIRADATTYPTITGGTAVAGTTYHVVWWWNGSILRLYVNGTQVGGDATATSRYATTDTAPFYIGNIVDGDYFQGTIDEVAFYPTAISAARIIAHRDAGTGVGGGGGGSITRDTHDLDTQGIGLTTNLSGTQPVVTLVTLNAAAVGSTWTFTNQSANTASIRVRDGNEWGVTQPSAGFEPASPDGDIFTQRVINHTPVIGQTSTLARAYLYATATGSQNVRMMIYNDSSGEPSTLLATSTSRSLSQANMPNGALFTPGWIDFTFPSAFTLPSVFHIGIQFGTTAGVFRLGATGMVNTPGDRSGGRGKTTTTSFSLGAPANLTGLTTTRGQLEHLQVEAGLDPPTLTGTVLDLPSGQTGTVTKTGATAYSVSIGAPSNPTPTITWVHGKIFQGARIEGQYYVTNYGATTAGNLDPPYSELGSTPPTPLSIFESHIGRQVNFINYGGLGSAWPPQDFFTGYADVVWNHGSFPYYGHGYNTCGLEDLYDNNSTAWSYIGTWATQVKNWAHPVLHRPIWEMQADWGPQGGYFWQTTYGITAQEYRIIWRNMWQIIADVMSGFTAGSGLGTHTGNMSLYWCPHIITSFGNSPDPTPWFPGNKYVDWVGWDGYAYDYEPYKSPSQIYDSVYNAIRAISPDKPMAIGEMGVASAISTPGKAAWFTDFFDTWLPAHPQVKMFSYYNFNYAPSLPGVYIEEGANAQSTYASKMGNTKFANTVNGTTFPNNTKVPYPGGVP